MKKLFFTLAVFICLIPGLNFGQLLNPNSNPEFYAWYRISEQIGFCRFTANNPDTLQTLFLNNSIINAMAVAKDVLYGIAYTTPYTPHKLVTIDSTTGTIKVICDINFKKHEGVFSMAWDPVTKTMYTASTMYSGINGTTKLYTVDLFTGELNYIGVIGPFILIDMAFNKEGKLYGIEEKNSYFFSINKSTAAATMIGRMNIDIIYRSSLSFDPSTGDLYLNALDWQSPYDGNELRTINLQTGRTKLVPGGGLFPIDYFFGGMVLSTDAGVLIDYNLTLPETSDTIYTLENSDEVFATDWHPLKPKANHRWIFTSSHSGTPVNFEIYFHGPPALTLGFIDSILSAKGVGYNTPLTGTWDLWTYRNNYDYDSLKAQNGPRSITFVRSKPQLIPFQLLAPDNNTSITTGEHNLDTVYFLWNRSSVGVKYKWNLYKENSLFYSLNSENSGYDTTLRMTNAKLDTLLEGAGILRGGELNAKWVITGVNQQDTISSNTFFINLKRSPYPQFLIVYDSIGIWGKKSLDSAKNVLDAFGFTYDVFPFKSYPDNQHKSLMGYSVVIWLANKYNLITNRLKDSVKRYIDNQTGGNFIFLSTHAAFYIGGTIGSLVDTGFFQHYLGSKFLTTLFPLTGQYEFRIVGDRINTSMTDSLPFADASIISPSWIGGERLIKYDVISGQDSCFAVGRKNSKINTVVVASDLLGINPAYDSPPGSPVKRLLTGIFEYLNISIPIELNSFTYSIENNNSVNLKWTTATETNNKGFEVVRKDNTGDFISLGFIQGAGTSTESKDYSFKDKDLPAGIYNYRLKQIDYDGSYKYYNLNSEVTIQRPEKYSLGQNYPNPFNPATKISFTLPYSILTEVKVYDIFGSEVATLVNEVLPGGTHQIDFDGRNFASGVYFYRIKAGNFTSAKKMIMLK